MIDRILIDPTRNIFNSLDSIIEKLNYYRAISENGISKLTVHEFEALKIDVEKFFNLEFFAFTDTKLDTIFRVSLNSIEKNDILLRKFSQIIGPPNNCSKFNRCNFPGESIFYGSLDESTIYWETRPQIGDRITLSLWKTKDNKEIKVHGIFNHPEIVGSNALSKKIYGDYINEINRLHPFSAHFYDSILKFITEEFIKPVKKENPKEYLFSAFFSSSLFKSSIDGFQIDGIIYPSIQRKYNKTNIAIRNSEVITNLDLVEVKSFIVGQTFYETELKNNEPPISVLPWDIPMTKFDIEKNEILYDETNEKLIQEAKNFLKI